MSLTTKEKAKIIKGRELQTKKTQAPPSAIVLVIQNNRQAGFAFEKAPSGRAISKRLLTMVIKRKKTACLF